LAGAGFRHRARSTFTSRSENKVGGTAAKAEHRAIPFVVGAGNADTREETFNE
jgi:hypothetical protein